MYVRTDRLYAQVVRTGCVGQCVQTKCAYRVYGQEHGMDNKEGKKEGKEGGRRLN